MYALLPGPVGDFLRGGGWGNYFSGWFWGRILLPGAGGLGSRALGLGDAVGDLCLVGSGTDASAR